MKNKKIILQLICCAAAVTAFTVPVHAQITEKAARQRDKWLYLKEPPTAQKALSRIR